MASSPSSVFSPLAHGCGSWNGDLQKHLQENKTKQLLSRSLDGESYDHLEKRVTIPLRIKSHLSQIKSILREASKNYPEQSQAAEQNLADIIRNKTDHTEYSRPLGAVKPRPRTGVIRSDKQQARPSLGGVRSHRFHQRAKSAPSSRPSQRQVSSTAKRRIDSTLPKTLTTRKGALMIFTSPKNVAFSVPEQNCYHVDPNAVNMDAWATNLQSFKKLTNSVLHYGSEIGDDLESLSAAAEADYDTSCFRFLRKEEDERGVDLRLQPGGDFVFYLKDMKTKAAVRNVVSAMSHVSATPTEDEADEFIETMQQLDDQDIESTHHAEGNGVPPRTEHLRPSSVMAVGGNHAWSSRTGTGTETETESMTVDVNGPGGAGSTTTETTVRFAPPEDSHLANRPDTAKSNRSIGSLRSGTPLSFRDLTASIKSTGYLGRPISAPYPPYSPHPRTPSVPPEVHIEREEEEMDEFEEEEDGESEGRASSAKSRSSRPRSSRAGSRRSQRSAAGDDLSSGGRSSRGQRSRVGSARSRMSSAGGRSSQRGDDVQEELDVGMVDDDDDWMSEDLPELGVEDLEPDTAPGEGIEDGEKGEAGEQDLAPGPDVPPSQASSEPPRAYTPKTRSSRRSTPPPEGDEWPGLDDDRPASAADRASSAKSRQSVRSRPGTSGSSRRSRLGDQDIVEEVIEPEQPPTPPSVDQGQGETLQLVGEGVGPPREPEAAAKSPSIPSRPSTSNSHPSQPLLEEPTKTPTPQPPPTKTPTPQPPSVIPTPPPPQQQATPPPQVHHTPTPPPTRVKSAVPKKKDAVEEEKKPAVKIDLSGLSSAVAKKPPGLSIPKAEKRSPSPKARKKKGGGKGGGSSPRRKLGGVDFIDNPGASSYDEPSQDEVAKMIQEELSQQMADAKISLEEEEEKKEEQVDPNDTDRASVATDDEAIEQEIKKESKTEKGTKKSKKQLAKERAALKEARRQEKLRREEEKKALLEKRKAAEKEKMRKEYEEQRRKQEIEEQLQEAEEEARRAEEEEEAARLMLQESRRAAREEREKRRKEEMERKKVERERQREERRKMEDAARQREREMAERLADAAERRRLREEAEWEAEEREREERERREQEEEEEMRRMEMEEEKMRELERQAEQEALERLSRERRDAEQRRRQAREDAERQKEEEERKMREELKRLAEEEEKERLRQEEAERKRQEELEKIRKIQQMEEEARARVQKKLEQRRLWALRRRERNNEQRAHLNGVRYTQGMTRPWVFSYYVLWPRDTYEKRLPTKEKKKGFRPRPKPPKSAPAGVAPGATAPPMQGPPGAGGGKVQLAGQATTGSQ